VGGEEEEKKENQDLKAEVVLWEGIGFF